MKDRYAKRLDKINRKPNNNSNSKLDNPVSIAIPNKAILTLLGKN